MNYERILAFFSSGMWNENMVKVAVRKGIITKEQYKEITGKTYTAPASASGSTATEEIESLKSQVAILSEQNAVLEECIVEMAQVVYA